MVGLLAAMGAEGAALALLIAGHVLADFAFQARWMVEGKPAQGPLAAHGLVVIATQAIVLAPMLTPRTGLLVLAIGASHVVIDAGKGWLRARGRPGSLGLFLGDQALHVLVLLVAWTQIPSGAWTASPVVEAFGGVSAEAWSMVATGAIYVSAFVFAHHGANAIVQGVLPEAPIPPDGTSSADDLEAGATIGTLERWIVMGLVLLGQWEALALVIAAKSIARFEELKHRPFAEYFLVGTLASVLVGIVLALGARALAGA